MDLQEDDNHAPEALFLNRDEDLQFRRVTWLLSVIKERGDTKPSPSYNMDTFSGLRELRSFANLLVRHHEVVAVMANGSHDESLGVVVSGGLVSRGIGSDCLVTRNLRRCVSCPVKMPQF